VNLNFWSNGFSVDDGPLRDMNDPENAEFLDAVKRGWVTTHIYVSFTTTLIQEEHYFRFLPVVTLCQYYKTSRPLGRKVQKSIE
jgi:hypothetical protein